MVKELIKKGANVNAQDGGGYTALMGAAGRGHAKVTWWLQMITKMGMLC